MGRKDSDDTLKKSESRIETLNTLKNSPGIIQVNKAAKMSGTQ